MKNLKLTWVFIALTSFLISCEKEIDVPAEEITEIAEVPELGAKQGPCPLYINRITYHYTTYCNNLKRQHERNGSNWHQRWWWARHRGCLDRVICTDK